MSVGYARKERILRDFLVPEHLRHTFLTHDISSPSAAPHHYLRAPSTSSRTARQDHAHATPFHLRLTTITRLEPFPANTSRASSRKQTRCSGVPIAREA